MTRISFEPLLERWGEYRFPDDIVLRGRLHLTSVDQERRKKATEGGRQLRVNTLLETRAPEPLRGKPSEDLSDLISRPILKKYTRWTTVAEAISIYLLEDGSLLRCKYSPHAIRRTDVYNRNGEPVLLVDAEQEILSDPSFIDVQRDQARQQAKETRTRSKK